MKRFLYSLLATLAMTLAGNTAARADDTDMSSYFTNLNFEEYKSGNSESENMPGWTVDNWMSGTGATGPWVNSNSGGANTCGSYYMQIYKPSGTRVDTEDLFHQESGNELPAGVYSVSVEAHVNTDKVVSLYAKVGDEESTQLLEKSEDNWSQTKTYTLSGITINSPAKLTIGISVASTTEELSMYFDNFTVKKTGDIESDDDFEDDGVEAWDETSAYFSNLNFEDCTTAADGEHEGSYYVSDCDPWDTSNYNKFSAKWTTKDVTYTQTPWPIIKDDAAATVGTASSGVSGKYMYVYTGYGENKDGTKSEELNTVSENTIVFYQSSAKRLPLGKYTISAVVHAQGTDNFALFANGDTEETTAIKATDSYSSAERYSVTVTVTKSVYLEIGIITTDAIKDTEATLYADNFRIVQEEAYNAEDIASGEDVWMDSSEYGFQNLGFEDYAESEDETTFKTWSVSNYSSGDDVEYTMHRVKADEFMSSYVDGHVFEAWIPSGYIDKVEGDFLYQTVEVPAGYYTISAAVYCDNEGIYLFACDAKNETNYVEEECPVGLAWKNAKIVTTDSIYVAEPTSLKFGLRSKIETGASLNGSELNIYADNFEVYDERCVAQVTSAGYATYFSNHKYLIAEGLEGATITGYTANQDNVEGVTGTLTKNWEYSADGDNTEVPKKTALLLRGDEGTYYCHITEEGDGTGDMNPEDPNNMLLGSATETKTTGPNGETDGYKFYMLSYGADGTGYENTLGFYYGANCENGQAFTSEAHKAWLPIEDNGTGSVKLIGFTLDDDETTGITGLSNAPASDAVYNLQGMRVSDASRKGLYIVGGKKVIVK